MLKQADRTYLINVAETLQHVILPRLDGAAHSRALDCLHAVTRIAAHLDDPPARIDGVAVTDALVQGRFFEEADARALELIAQITQSPAPAGRQFDAQALETYLQAHARGGPALRLRGARALPGGRSKQTILASQDGALDLPPDFVIRQDWSGSVVDSAVYTEFEVLKRLHAAGVRVPQPLLLEPGAAALGSPFIVVTRLPGKVVGDLFTPPPSSGPVLDMAAQMAAFHALPADEFARLPGIVERNLGTAALLQNLAAFRAVIDRFETESPELLNAALDHLQATVDRVQTVRSLVHGDIGFHNNLCEGDALTAVLDWELAHIGNPALDLGYVKSAVEAAMPWPQFMQRYRDAGGPELDAFTVDWFSLYTSVWFRHVMLQARAGLMSGALHDMEISFVCAHFGPMALARISRRLRTALQAPAESI